MTHCNTTPLRLSKLQRRQVQADFAGGRLTSDAGLLLLRECDRQLGLIRQVDACLADPRDPGRIEHEQSTMLAQRIFAIAAGYEDLNDHQRLRLDPALQLAAEQTPHEDEALASAPTLCRLERRVTRDALVKMQAVLVEQFIASHEAAGTPPASIVLDFDATDDPIHGKQEGRFFHGYYDHHCYLPLYVFCGEQLLCAYLRPSNIDPALHTRAILKLLVERIRASWPTTKIIFRGDSGFCRWKLMRWCDSHGVGYVLGLARNPVLERLAQPWTVPAAWHVQRCGEKVRLFGSFAYAASTWDRSRRVIVKAEHMTGERGANPRFVVTNLAGEEQTLYEQWYCQRGEMENRIKEQQLGLFADRTSCRTLLSNQLRLLLSSFAYVFFEHLRRTALAGTTLAKAQVSTIRLRLLKLAARVVVSARRVMFHLSTAHPEQALWRRLISRLTPL